MNPRVAVGLTLLVSVVSSAAVARADDAVTPGELIVEPPTLLNLGFEWPIQGDEDRDATVSVEYRRKGERAWRNAQPLLRIGDERVWRDRENMTYTTPRLFAGSVLDLEPGTTYECRFTMRDPDGVRGEAVRQVSVTTRREPSAWDGGPAKDNVRHVYPVGYKGPKQEPAYEGLMHAYYGAGMGDWDVVWERPVKPGDVILVHAGLYKSDPRNYVDRHRLPFHGSYVLTIDGTAERPIVIKAAGDGEVVFDGNGVARLFDVMAADHHHFEGLTIRNTEIAFFAGGKDVLGSSGLVVRNNHVHDVGIGVLAQHAGSRDFYIVDNVFVGRDSPHLLVGWRDPGPYEPARLDSYIGIKVYGQGHVIAHNRLSYFHDGVTVCTHGPPRNGEKAAAIDIYNNDIFTMVDDIIEADGGVHNIRVMRNRGFNAAQNGLSVQPVFGGPAYFVRNVIYNVPMLHAIKMGGANPAGIVFLHNTFVAEASDAGGSSNAHFRNNLFLGTERPRPVLRIGTYTSYSTLDYNGYRPNRTGGPQFHWKAPAGGALADFTGAGPWRTFATLAEFSRATGQERHGVVVDYDVFRNVRPPDPKRNHAIYPVGDTDFRLRPGSKAVDAGVRLANVNDDFTGRAPDLGALESGRPQPIYGPRPARSQPASSAPSLSLSSRAP